MKITNHADPRDLYTQIELQNAFKIFDSEIYPNDESIMCSIHDSFHREDDKAHNCIGCNFADYTQLLHSALQSGPVSAPLEAFSSVILYSNLLVERFEEIFKIVKLPDSYRLRHFQVFGRIRKWANFLKHPKAFMLVHHPDYYFEREITVEPGDEKTHIFIDQAFVDEYYSGDKENNKLYSLLSNKKNVVVLLPTLDELMVDFCAAQKKYIEIISKNEVFRELLDEKSTMKNYFEGETDDTTPNGQ
ncbi:MAG: hypothetical protein ACKVPJ_08615 [Chitinophagales bacterium]